MFEDDNEYIRAAVLLQSHSHPHMSRFKLLKLVIQNTYLIVTLNI